MITQTMACAHFSVASHGVETGNARKPGNASAEEHETGWCRDCSQYVQRELDGLAWTLQIGYEKGAWLWRPSNRPAPRG